MSDFKCTPTQLLAAAAAVLGVLAYWWVLIPAIAWAMGWL